MYGAGRGGRPWRRLREQVFARDQYTCAVCGRVTVDDLQCDHIVAIANGGTDDMSNLRAICADCHAVKTAIDRTGNAPRRVAIGSDGWPVAQCVKRGTI